MKSCPRLLAVWVKWQGAACYTGDQNVHIKIRETIFLSVLKCVKGQCWRTHYGLGWWGGSIELRSETRKVWRAVQPTRYSCSNQFEIGVCLLSSSVDNALLLIHESTSINTHKNICHHCSGTIWQWKKVSVFARPSPTYQNITFRLPIYISCSAPLTVSAGFPRGTRPANNKHKRGCLAFLLAVVRLARHVVVALGGVFLEQGLDFRLLLLHVFHHVVVVVDVADIVVFVAVLLRQLWRRVS